MPITEEQRKRYNEYARNWRQTERGRDYAIKRRNSVKGTPQYLAQMKLLTMVRNGTIPRAMDLNCVDCLVDGITKKADCYDHRDYSKPLEVDPVCRSHNLLRGPGLNK